MRPYALLAFRLTFLPVSASAQEPASYETTSEERMKSLLGLFLASVLATSSWAEDTAKPTIVPVTKAAFHLFTFQNENMALESVTLPPGRSTGYHSHDQDLVFVITAGAKIKNQVLGKDPVELEFKLGEVRFAPYTKTPGVHQVINLETDKMMRLLAVAIVYPEPGRYTVSTRPAKYEVVLDNDRVRAWRLKLHQGESAPVIQQTAPGARFVVTGGTIAEKRPGKPDQPMVLKNHEFLEMVVEGRGIENIGSSPVELVEIELK
jgi:quercetin dioxygenase-like cupin family protein